MSNWGSVGSGPFCGTYKGWEVGVDLNPKRPPQLRPFAPKNYKRVDHADVPPELLKLYADSDNNQVQAPDNCSC